MASSNQQLMKIDEDPYKSEEGHIELKIENFTGFVQEPIGSRRFSDPVHVRGVIWRVFAILREYVPPVGNGQKQKCLCYLLHCGGGTDPFWSCSATATLEILTQKEGSIGCVEHLDISHIFHAKNANIRIGKHLHFEDIMNPDKGWYDLQADFIILAADLKVSAVPEGFDEYAIVVAQNELKFDKRPSHFSMQFGNLEWEIIFDNDATKKGEKSLVLSCKDVAKGRVDKAALELFGYNRDDPKTEAYSPISPERTVYRHLFTSEDNSLTVNVPRKCALNNTLFTIRMLKEHNQFPDFTKSTTMVGSNPANVKLLVDDQKFHVNKQLLSTLSPFFDRMFYGVHPDATKEEVKLDLCMHSPQLFHDFLLIMCVNEALPKSTNVTALFKLADFYNAENVRKKCDQYIRMAREMPIEKRVLLARDHGSKETQALIVDSANFEQSKCINLILMQNCAI